MMVLVLESGSKNHSSLSMNEKRSSKILQINIVIFVFKAREKIIQKMT